MTKRKGFITLAPVVDLLLQPAARLTRDSGSSRPSGPTLSRPWRPSSRLRPQLFAPKFFQTVLAKVGENGKFRAFKWPSSLRTQLILLNGLPNGKAGIGKV